MTLHIGEPSNDFVDPTESTRRVNIVFNDFQGSTQTTGEYVDSPEFDALGHRLAVRFYPSHSGGDGTYNTKVCM